MLSNNKSVNNPKTAPVTVGNSEPLFCERRVNRQHGPACEGKSVQIRPESQRQMADPVSSFAGSDTSATLCLDSHHSTNTLFSV